MPALTLMCQFQGRSDSSPLFATPSWRRLAEACCAADEGSMAPGGVAVGTGLQEMGNDRAWAGVGAVRHGKRQLLRCMVEIAWCAETPWLACGSVLDTPQHVILPETSFVHAVSHC